MLPVHDRGEFVLDETVTLTLSISGPQRRPPTALPRRDTDGFGQFTAPLSLDYSPREGRGSATSTASTETNRCRRPSCDADHEHAAPRTEDELALLFTPGGIAACSRPGG